ncbi:MAG: metallophosphoesterase [Gammaproteobacteria bacterium]|nr:metallophosphoesterase [Gammaproteobacteria bacterium]
MHRFWIIPTIVLLLLIFYTNFKVGQFLPECKVLAMLITLLLFAMMIGWEIIYRYNVSLADNLWFRALAWTGSTLLGIWVTFILFSLLIDMGYLVFLTVTKLNNFSLFTPMQNSILFQRISIVIFIIALLIAGFGLKTALSVPKIIDIFVPISGKLSSLQEMKIVQISDLHVGALIRHDYIENVVQEVNKLKPDLIVFTGDVADGTVQGLIKQLQPLAKLYAPLGKFYVTGNHEYYWGAKQWVNGMRELGFTPLINENQIIDFKGVKILVAGVTDVSAGQFLPEHKPDIQQAILSNEHSDLKVLLSHSPRTLCEAGVAGFDLQLSGHTHAGQFFPFSLLLPLAHKYHNGLNCQDDIWLYVNSGTGSWGPVNRFGVHSEITVIGFREEAKI